MSDLNKKPAQIKAVRVDNSKLLPPVLATDPNKKMIESTLDVMTSKGQLLPFKETQGSRTTALTDNNFIKEELDPVRKESSSNIALITKSTAGEFKRKVSYLDIENYFNIKGLPLKDGVQLDSDIFTADLPVNYRYLTDYQLYYWLEWDLPAIELYAEPTETGGKPYSITEDIIGHPYAVIRDDKTGKTLELMSGMYVYFTGSQDERFISVDADDPIVFRVSGVGDSISLIKISNFDERIPRGYLKKRTWDKVEKTVEPPAIYWDSEKWDGSASTPAIPEYVVMTRYSSDFNPWSVLDRWYHITTIRTVANFLDIPVDDFARPELQAKRPIISFSRNIRLYNWPTRNLGDINGVLDGSLADFQGRKTIVDSIGYTLVNNDRVVFVRTPGVWSVSGVGSSINFTKVRDSVEGDGALIVTVSDKLYYKLIFRNGEWSYAQNKTTANQTPLFEFYRSNGESLEDRANTTFKGGIILGFKDGSVYDTVLDRNISVSNIDFDVINESNTSTISSNQIQFVTDIDRAFLEFEENSSLDVEFKEPWGYKIGNRITPFYIKRQGIDATRAMQDLTYTGESTILSPDVQPAVQGFNEIHLYPKETGFAIYYKIDGLGILPFTTNKASVQFEKNIPLILGTTVRIHCHNLTYPIYFKRVDINKTSELNEYQIRNNGITDGIIEINLNSTYTVNDEVVTNSIANDTTRLEWMYNGVPGSSIIRNVEDWRFIFSAYHLDRTNPVFNGYDFRLEENTPITYTKKMIANVPLIKKIRSGAKIGVETFLKSNSVSGEPAKKTAPLALTTNPLNAEFTSLNYYSLYQHTNIAISTTPAARQLAEPGEKRFSTPQQMSGGSLIKHNNPLARFAVAATTAPFDISSTLIKQGKHYDLFLNRLTVELEKIINSYDTEKYSQLDLIGLALEQIYLNQTDIDAFWSHSNMIGWGDTYDEEVVTIPTTGYVSLLGNLEAIKHEAGKELLLHIIVDGKLLVRNQDYVLESELDGYYTRVKFATDLLGKIATLRQWPDTFNSRIPASLAKIGLAPSYMPEILLDQSYTTAEVYFMTRHDGSRYFIKSGVTETDGKLYPEDLLDQLLYEYELAVWSSIAKNVEQNNQHRLYSGIPGGFRPTRNMYGEVLELVNNEMYSWMQDNMLYVLDNKNYDPADPFTYRYQLGSGDEADTVTGTWRAIYRYFYDTDRPHTHPWEMLGYTVKPVWWDTYYSWTDPVKRQALEQALRSGNVAEPPKVNCMPWLARNNNLLEVQDFPVDEYGMLIPPTQLPWLADQLSFDDGDWAPGDFGPYEMVFRSTHRGIAAVVNAHYLSNPVEYFNLNWVPGGTKFNEWGHRVDSATNTWLSPAIAHDHHRKDLGDNRINYTAGLESLLVEFCVLANKDYVAEIIDPLNNTIVNKEFLLSGFSNKNNVRIQSNSASNQSKSLFVPEENYSVRTLNHYPDREDFYSAIRIVWDGESWNVFGFTNEKTSFYYYEPAELSPTVAITVGDYTVKEKTRYNTALRKTLRYGASFDNRQNLYDFILGYGKYLESQGFIFDDVESGDVRNWQLSAKQFIFWSNDPLAAGNYLDLNPAANGIKIELQTGQLCGLEGSDLNAGLVVDRFSKPIFSKDLIVSRRNPFVVTTKNADRPIYGIKLTFVTYESVLHLDGTSIFNDIYFIPEQATSKRSFTLGGKKSQEWDGSYWVPGYMFSNMDLIPNLDTMSELGRNLLDVENVVNDRQILDASRSQFGLNRNPELRQLFLSDDSETLFKTAIAFDKGTRKVFNSIEPLTHKDGTSVTAYEEYMVRTGEIGNTNNIKYYEFQFEKDEYKHDPQIIKFSNDGDTSGKKSYVLDSSKRWVARPFGKKLRFDTFDVPYTTVKTSGPINNGDTDYIAEYVDDIKNIFPEFEPLWIIPAFNETAKYKKGDQVRRNGKLYIANTTVSPNAWTVNQDFFTEINEPFLPNIYVKNYTKAVTGTTTGPSTVTKDTTPASWQILQLMDTNIGINEACPGLVDTDKARINTNKDPKVVPGDLVLIVNADNGASSVNGIWTVQSVETNTDSATPQHYFYLDTNVPGTIKTGKVFVFRPVRFASQEDLTRATPENGYVWNKKFNPKENIIDNANIVPPNTPSGFSAVQPIAVVDDAASLITQSPNSYNFGNYTVYQMYKDSDPLPVKTQSKPVDPSNIEQLLIYSYDEGKTLAKIDLFDPKKGKFLDVFVKDIDVINRVDPARYTRTTDDYKTVYNSIGWFSNYIGRRWWDTSTIQFQDYENGSDVERANIWGTTVDGALPDIYEWTKSPVHPSKWDDLVKNKGDAFGVKASGQAYFNVVTGIKNYYWSEETEFRTGKAYTVYYFWVKNKNTIPEESKFARTYTTAQLSKILLNPSAAGLPWWAPISNDAMIIKGVENYLASSGTVIQIKIKDAGNEKHHQWMFVSEGNSLQIIPEWMHIRLRDSLSTMMKYRRGSAATEIADYYVSRVVPSPVFLHPFNRTGNMVRPFMKSWFEDALEARRTFIKKANELLINMDLVKGIQGWDSILGQTDYAWADETIDMTIVWTYADYVSKNYDSSKVVDKTVETQLDMVSLSVVDGTYVMVTKEDAVYEKLSTGGWEVVKRRNGTIQFNDDLFTKKSIGGWDPTPWANLPWDYNLNGHVSAIVDALRYDIFVNQYVANYSIVVCSMFRYILSEQLTVDWLAKSSTILPYNTIGASFTTDEDLQRDNISALNSFYSTVKSYRDKTRGGDVSKNALEDANTSIEEFPVLNVEMEFSRFTKDEDGEVFELSTEQVDKVISGLDFVPVGWDATGFDIDTFGDVGATAGWDSFAKQTVFDQYLQKMYVGSSDPTVNITGMGTKPGYQEEECVVQITDSLVVDLTQAGITVRQHYFANTVSAFILDNSKSVLTGNVTQDANFIGLTNMDIVPDATPDTPATIWIGNERIIYTIKEETGVSGLIRGSFGTPAMAHSVNSPVYLVSADTILHGHIPVVALNKRVQFYNDIGSTLGDSINPIAKRITNYSGS